MQKIMVEADLSVPAVGYSEEEKAFRAEVERDIKDAHRRADERP